jgi:hypothetical protein
MSLGARGVTIEEDSVAIKSGCYVDIFVEGGGLQIRWLSGTTLST